MNKTCDCGRDMWLYDSNTWTCKAGHRETVAMSPIGASDVEELDEYTIEFYGARWRVYGVPAMFGFIGAALCEFLVHIF